VRIRDDLSDVRRRVLDPFNRASSSDTSFMQGSMQINALVGRLIQAKSEYRRGHKFSTYASWWIRRAAGRSLYD
jgi:hypothetical protein